MADELKHTISGALANGDLKRSFSPGTVSVTQTTKAAHSEVTLVGTSEEDLSLPDTGSNGGTLYLESLLAADPANPSANFVQYGPSDAGTMRAIGCLKPGEVATVRLAPAVTLRWKADNQTHPVRVEFFAD